MTHRADDVPTANKHEFTLRLSIPFLEGENPLLTKGVEFLDSLVGEPIRIAGGMLSDQLYAWRWQNRIRIGAKARQKVEEVRGNTVPVPPAFLLPFLEAAGDVDSEELQDLWARLLASVATGAAEHHPAFVRTPQQFSAVEAHLLTWLAGPLVIPAYVSVTDYGPAKAVVVDKISLLADASPDSISYALFNLDRLGVVSVKSGMPMEKIRDQAFSDAYDRLHDRFRQAFGDRGRMNGCVELTAFGGVARACIGTVGGDPVYRTPA